MLFNQNGKKEVQRTPGNMWQNITRLDHLHWPILPCYTPAEIALVQVSMLKKLQGIRSTSFKVSDTLKNFKLAVDSQVGRLMSDYMRSSTSPLCGGSKYGRGGKKFKG